MVDADQIALNFGSFGIDQEQPGRIVSTDHVAKLGGRPPDDDVVDIIDRHTELSVAGDRRGREHPKEATLDPCPLGAFCDCEAVVSEGTHRQALHHAVGTGKYQS